jgi:hypothetical protein
MLEAAHMAAHDSFAVIRPTMMRMTPSGNTNWTELAIWMP